MDLLHKHRQWFDGFQKQVVRGRTAAPLGGLRYSCPCCGYPTLTARKAYETCELCSWEDDGQDDDNADTIMGGPNGRYSLAEARVNFARYLTMYNPDKTSHVFNKPYWNSAIADSAKRELVALFNNMIEYENWAVPDELWAQVQRQEQILREDLHNRIGAYHRYMGWNR